MATSAERYCGGEQKWWSQPVSRPPCTPNQQAIANYSKLYPGGPIPHNLARALMPRQPYSVAVLSTGGRLHPRFLRKRGLGRKWSPLWKEGRGDSKNLIITTKIKTRTMNIIKTEIEGVLIIEPRLFRDARGYFFESFSEREFEEKVAPILGHSVHFCQDNESMSSYGVMRGLHFQRPPYTQSKLVRCVKGRVLD